MAAGAPSGMGRLCIMVAIVICSLSVCTAHITGLVSGVTGVSVDHVPPFGGASALLFVRGWERLDLPVVASLSLAVPRILNSSSEMSRTHIPDLCGLLFLASGAVLLATCTWVEMGERVFNKSSSEQSGYPLLLLA